MTSAAPAISDTNGGTLTTRRLGPLRKTHLELLKQSQARGESALAQIRELERAAKADALGVVSLVVEDLGGEFKPGESVRPVTEGESTYLEIQGPKEPA